TCSFSSLTRARNAAFSASSSAMRACASTATFYFAARGEWWTIDALRATRGDWLRHDLVMATVVPSKDGTAYVTVRVYTRYAQATEDRPISISFQLQIPEDHPDALLLHQNVEDAFLFGSRAELPDGLVHGLTIDAPSGLGVENAVGGLRLGGCPDGEIERFRVILRLTTLAGEALGEAVCDARERTRGTGGVRLLFEEVNKSFSFELRFKLSKQGEPCLELSHFHVDLAKSPATRLLPVARLLNEMKGSNLLSLVLEHGSLLADSIPLPNDEPPVDTRLLLLTEAIAAIQVRTLHPLYLPSEISADQCRLIIEAGRLVRGLPSRGTWEEFPVQLGSQAIHDLNHASTPQLALEGEFEVDIGGRMVSIGRSTMVLRSAKVVPAESAPAGADGDVAVLVRPDEDNRYERWPGTIEDYQQRCTDAMAANTGEPESPT
ncbi:MAG: hypothetical protein ACRDX9_04765, partial [Acidimicrobiia bacterium]